MKHYVFTYGTLAEKSILHRLIRKTPRLIPATLKKYALYEDETPWYFVKPHDSRDVVGYVFKVNDEDLIRLDAWEDVPIYQREIKQVTLNNNKVVKAYVYVKEPIGKTKIIDNKLDSYSKKSDRFSIDIPQYHKNLFDLTYSCTLKINLSKYLKHKMTNDESTFLYAVNQASKVNYATCFKLDIKLNNYSYTAYALIRLMNGKTKILVFMLQMSLSADKLVQLINFEDLIITYNDIDLTKKSSIIVH